MIWTWNGRNGICYKLISLCHGLCKIVPFLIEKMEFYCFPTAMCLLRGKVHINYYDQIAEIQQQIIYMIEVTKDNHLESF